VNGFEGMRARIAGCALIVSSCLWAGAVIYQECAKLAHVPVSIVELSALGFPDLAILDMSYVFHLFGAFVAMACGGLLIVLTPVREVGLSAYALWAVSMAWSMPALSVY